MEDQGVQGKEIQASLGLCFLIQVFNFSMSLLVDRSKPLSKISTKRTQTDVLLFLGHDRVGAAEDLN